MRQIEFVYPRNTHPISLTGTKCSLNCKHCEGNYLRHMFPADSERKGKTSVLLSGGFDRNGQLNLPDWTFKKIKDCKINIHPGLVNFMQAKFIGKHVHSVSFDFPSGNEVIQNVYGLNKTMSDYIYSYKLLRAACKNVVPHICIGLGGNELKAVNLLGKLGFDEIVFLVLIPNKQMKNVPSIDRVVGLLRKTRTMFPGKTISLGCMRPAGKYRDELDKKALFYADKIVIPSKSAVELAKQKNFKIKEKFECCVL
jgi:hypothetical protein